MLCAWQSWLYFLNILIITICQYEKQKLKSKMQTAQSKPFAAH